MPPRKRPASATPDLPEQPTPSTSRSPRTTQTARKSTGGAAPRRQLSGPYPSPSPSHHDVTLAPAPEPEIPCDLCKFPRPPHDPSLPPPPAHTFKTTCRHLFHHYCYMNYLVVAPGDGWAHCPRCRANMLTRNRLWVDIADNAAPNPSYLDLTEEVEARRHAVRQAKEQVFRDMLVTRNFLVAASLLTGPDAVDVNCRSPLTGQTMLHFCAMANDVDGVAFLLQNGADKSLLDDAGLLAIDRARSNNAWNSANLPA
ncbi:hypothetical protein B0H10DRAFT_629298 [Mycena sp. CBHHK59/15]|nr:hypothetical protein B0H10DRAFT_629298 [Mycena sp. CBHHK59/15]